MTRNVKTKLEQRTKQEVIATGRKEERTDYKKKEQKQTNATKEAQLIDELQENMEENSKDSRKLFQHIKRQNRKNNLTVHIQKHIGKF